VETKLPGLIRFGREVCGRPRSGRNVASWWLANGLGGYASGTIAGTLTRRLSRIADCAGETATRPSCGDGEGRCDAGFRASRQWPLFTNRWSGGTVASERLSSISRPSSSTAASRSGVTPAASCASRAASGWSTARTPLIIAWRLAPDSPVPEQVPVLRVKLLVNARDFHGTARPWEFNPVLEGSGPELRVDPPETGSLSTLKARGGAIVTRHEWYENFDLSVERERGLSDREQPSAGGRGPS